MALQHAKFNRFQGTLPVNQLEHRAAGHTPFRKPGNRIEIGLFEILFAEQHSEHRGMRKPADLRPTGLDARFDHDRPAQSHFGGHHAKPGRDAIPGLHLQGLPDGHEHIAPIDPVGGQR